MAYKNKVFISFDGDTDIHYYRLMLAWKQNDKTDFNFFNAHDISQARDTSLESTIKRSLRERLLNSRIFVILIGERTRYLTKFVRWEMEQAISLGLPIIGVNLNGFRQQDSDRCPPIIKDELVVYVSFNAAILQYALENWPNTFVRLKNENKTGPYYYPENIYRNLGL